MTAEAKELKVGEKVYSLDEIIAMQKQFAEMQGIIKAAKKEGLITKEEKPKVEKIYTAEENLFLEQIKSVFESNVAVIEGLFGKTKSESDPVGQIGINFAITDKFGFQLLSEDARKAKVKANKEKKAAEKAKTEVKPEIADAPNS
jgi:hypothetical protein